MLFVLIIAIFVLIGWVAFRGDYENEEKAKDYRKYEEIIYGNDKPKKVRGNL